MQSKTNMWVWIILLLGAIGAAVYFFWYKPKQEKNTASTNPDNGNGTKPGNTSGGGGGSGNTTVNNGGGNSGSNANLPIKINTVNLNWGTSLNSLPSSFSPEGLIAQTILRYKGIKGANGKELTLDGKVGKNTKASIKTFFGEDIDNQDLTDLFNRSKVDMATVLANQKKNIESGTNNKYTV